MAMTQELKALGHAIAELQDEAFATRTRSPTPERLAGIYRAHAKRATFGRRASYTRPVIALGLVAAAALLFALSTSNKPLRFVVGPAKERGALGVWVAAPNEAPRAIAFSDGSQVILRVGARARVASVSEHGARIVVERGQVHADVVPRAHNDWWVSGGPFEIHVTGTSFDASWEPEHEVFRVVMYEGHVDIRGECLAHGRSLSKGESVTLSCSPPATAASSPSAIRAAVPTASLAAPLAAAVPSGVAANGRPAVPPKPASAAGIQAPSWHAWAKLGAYNEALAAAESEGFDALCDTLSLGELLELATTARLAGKAARAGEAYHAIRRRFPGMDGAATAAFHLGQIAFDSEHSYSDAHRWFTTYLGERPAGALAAEALGRTMEAEQRQGELDRARATADKYLRLYPGGAHQRLARSLSAP